MINNVFDLLDQVAAQDRQREFEQRAHAMPDWEKQFLLGFLRYTDAHPEVVDSACGGFGCVDGCGDCITSTVLPIACPFCPETHAPGKCPVAAAMTGQPLIAELRAELAKAQKVLERTRREIDANRAVISDAMQRYDFLYDSWRKAQSNEEIAGAVRKAMFDWEETRATLYVRETTR